MHARRHAALKLRARLYAAIRDFFAKRGVVEVETPILSEAGNTEPNIESFRALGAITGEAGRWLRTSPEFPLKRLLAEGFGDCYELGRVFRDGESGRRHNPEFTMLEWYRLGITHHQLADEVAELVQTALALTGRTLRIEKTGYRDLYSRQFGIDPFTASIETLRQPLDGLSIRADGLTRDDWLDLLMTHRLQPAFAPDALVFVSDFPPSQCALAKIAGQGGDAVAQRFEAYLAGQELANGYHELADAAEQRARFRNDNARRRTRGQMDVPIDERLLAALERGLPDCAGVALGIERLLMAMAGAERIGDVLAYAFDEA
ncbi:MAG: EF-P lysine aminoacylase EpmA [Lysobacteraceae bacterium]